MFTAAMIGAVCGAASTAGHVVARERQPIVGLVRAHATVTVRATIVTDPRPVGAVHIGPPTYGFDLHVEALTSETVSASVDAPIFGSPPALDGSACYLVSTSRSGVGLDRRIPVS